MTVFSKPNGQSEIRFMEDSTLEMVRQVGTPFLHLEYKWVAAPLEHGDHLARYFGVEAIKPEAIKRDRSNFFVRLIKHECVRAQ